MNDLMDINRAIIGRAREGATLTAGEIEELATTDVLSLGMLADEVRRARVGDRVTFVRVHDWVADRPVPPAATEVRLSTWPENLDRTIAAIASVRTAAGSRLLSGFSLGEVVDRVAFGWGSLGEIVEKLKTAGLDTIVHAPVDRLLDPQSAIRAAHDAGLTIGCLSVQQVSETPTDLLIRMRALAGQFPAIATVAPLPRLQTTSAPTTGYNDVRMVALARLVVSTAPHVQVDWSQYGPKLAQVALSFGADDLDRVSPIDDESVGRRRMAVEDVTRNITAAGFAAVERDARA